MFFCNSLLPNRGLSDKYLAIHAGDERRNDCGPKVYVVLLYNFKQNPLVYKF